jgi:spermidine/putrescine transport system permease protein
MIAKWFGRLYMVLVFVFLYAPVAVLIIFSFNAAKSRAVWGGFTLEWYSKLFHNRDILRALQVTLIVALVSALVSTLIATVTCLGLNAMRRKWRQAIMTVTYIPNVSPDLVTPASP